MFDHWDPCSKPIQPAAHFILASYGSLGTEWAARDPNTTDRETTIADLISGEIERPLQVIEVNVSEGTCRDVSLDIAEEIAARRTHLSEGLVAFIHRHAPALAREIDRRAA